MNRGKIYKRFEELDKCASLGGGVDKEEETIMSIRKLLIFLLFNNMPPKKHGNIPL